MVTSIPMVGVHTDGYQTGTLKSLKSRIIELVVKMKDSKDFVQTNLVANALNEAVEECENVFIVKHVNDDDKVIDLIKTAVNVTFNVIIAITMFLCFFALSSNMAANLMDQEKEIGVLRATGMNKCRVRLLFFYEALTMVFAACVLGVIVGLIVGYTMVLQQVLFLKITMPFFFPW